MRGGELRVLQVVATTPEAAVAAAAGAIRVARTGERVSIQLAGADEAVIAALQTNFRGPRTRRQDFYVLGKQV